MEQKTANEIIMLRIRSLISDKDMVTAQANHDLAMTGEWRVDYAAWHGQINDEMEGLFDALEKTDDDICGLCGLPGADKIPHALYWPGEARPNWPYVHADCEHEACERAQAAHTDRAQAAFLQSSSDGSDWSE